MGLALFLVYHYAQKLKQKRNPNKHIFYIALGFSVSALCVLLSVLMVVKALNQRSEKMKPISEILDIYDTDLTSDGYNNLISNIVCVIILSVATAVLNIQLILQLLLAVFAILAVIGAAGETISKQRFKQYFAIVYWMSTVDLYYLFFAFAVKTIFDAVN